jgi:hypothetical protein
MGLYGIWSATISRDDLIDAICELVATILDRYYGLR